MRPPRPETHQECRSLLQKAVRRGDRALVNTVARHLHETGDASWLYMRTSVIIFEECWPLGAELRPTKDLNSVLQTLDRLASAVKWKDAAGLGTLAYAFSQGNRSVLARQPEASTTDNEIEGIAHAITNPDEFWLRTRKNCNRADQLTLVESAEKAFRRGGWPWDRAFMQAAAYLATSCVVGPVNDSNTSQMPLPCWVAIDKHTSTGRDALRTTASSLRVPVRQLTWASFYCESARVNDSAPSPWWQRETQWRLGQVGLSLTEAEILWGKARPLMKDALREKATLLEEHLAASSADIARIEKADGDANPIGVQLQLPGF